MKLPSFFPKDEKFNRLLEQLSAEACQSAHHLKSFIDGQPDAGGAIAACKDKAKALATEITAELCRSFVTPFDREDIQDLADIMYKIPKIIEKIKERILMHNVPRSEGDFSRQVDLIVREAAAMETLVQAMIKSRNTKKIMDSVTTLGKLEQEGDDIRNELFTALFAKERDTRDLIIRRDIYDMLEKVVDRFRDVAGVALKIVLKHS